MMTRIGVVLATIGVALGLGGCVTGGSGNGGWISLVDGALSSSDKEEIKKLPTEKAWAFLEEDGVAVTRWLGLGEARRRLASEIKQDAKPLLNNSEVPSQALDELVVSASRDLNKAILDFHRTRVEQGDSGPIVVAMGTIVYDGDGKKFGRTVNRIYDQVSSNTELAGKVAFVRYTETESDAILRKVAGDNYQQVFGDSQGRVSVGPASYPPSHVYVLTGDADVEGLSPVEQKVVLDMRLYHPQSRQTIPGTFTNSAEHIYLHPYFETGGYVGPSWITQPTNDSLRAALEASKQGSGK